MNLMKGDRLSSSERRRSTHGQQVMYDADNTCVQQMKMKKGWRSRRRAGRWCSEFPVELQLEHYTKIDLHQVTTSASGWRTEVKALNSKTRLLWTVPRVSRQEHPDGDGLVEPGRVHGGGVGAERRQLEERHRV